jgi:hypothetical protein
MLTGYLSLGAPAWRWLGEYATMDKSFAIFLCRGGSSARDFRMFCLVAHEEIRVRKIIVTLCKILQL